MDKRDYTLRYAPRGAHNTYLIAMIASAAGALAGIATEQWILLIPSAALLIVAERIRPYLGEHAQIHLDTDGLTLRGFGFLPWREVADARAFEHWTGSGVRAWLMIEIAGDLDARFPDRLGGLGRLQVRPWRRVGGRGLILRLEGLDDAPDGIRRAFERYLKRRIAVDRV
jgi:hypothetical protein